MFISAFHKHPNDHIPYKSASSNLQFLTQNFQNNSLLETSQIIYIGWSHGGDRE